MPKVEKFDKATIARKVRLTEGQKQCDWFEHLFEGRSLILSLSYKGTCSWSVLYYDKGKPRRQKLGTYPEMACKDARKAAREFDVEAATATVRAGSFEDVAEKWFTHHVEAKGLLSHREIRRHLTKYIYPAWQKRPFVEVRRGEVNELLREIAKRHGASQADAVLASIRGIMTWYQKETESYTSPIVRGMKQDKRELDQRQRDRILSPDEIHDVWKACDRLGSFGVIIKLCLLTGQRREKIAQMKWTDVDLQTGVWTIATEPREKGTAGVLRLPQLALDILNQHLDQQEGRQAGNPYVFPGSLQGRRRSAETRSGPPHFNAWSQRKKALDAELPWGTKPWRIHDLRRTARSLMADIGILDHVAERVLGHKQAGVQAIYNRHPYGDEKADALNKLAARIELIVNPPEGDNVITMTGRNAAQPLSGSV